MMQALALSLVLALHGQAETAGRCYDFERDSVALRGQVIRRVYPGRPNYESVRGGDEPDTVFVLRLASPLCMSASPAGEAQPAVTEVQLYFAEGDARAVHAMRGRKVVLRGTLEEWTLGWHHLPVLLHVRLSRGASTNQRAV